MRKRKYKNLKHPHMRIFILIACLLVAAAVVAFIIASSGDSMSASATKLPFYASWPSTFTGDGFLYISGSNLNYHAINDSKNSYSEVLVDPSPSLAGSGLTHVAYTSASLRIIGAQFPIESSGEIISVKCGGSFIAAHERKNGLDAIRIFDNLGNQIDELSFSDSRLMDFGFYYTNKTVSFYSLATDTKSSKPVSILTTYSLIPPATTGVVSIQNELILDVAFSANSIFVTGTADIIRYAASSNQESYRLLSYGFTTIDCTFSGKSAVFIAALNRVAPFDLSFVRVYHASEKDVPEESVSILQLPRDTLNVFASGDRVYVICPDRILKYHASSAQHAGEESLPFTATAAYKLSDDYLLVMSGEDVYLLAFKP